MASLPRIGTIICDAYSAYQVRKHHEDGRIDVVSIMGTPLTIKWEPVCQCCGVEWLHEVTASTVTPAQIDALREQLPRDHYARQWTIDALAPSASHPHRQGNARRECAKLINERARREWDAKRRSA